MSCGYKSEVSGGEVTGGQLGPFSAPGGCLLFPATWPLHNMAVSSSKGIRRISLTLHDSVLF